MYRADVHTNKQMPTVLNSFSKLLEKARALLDNELRTTGGEQLHAASQTHRKTIGDRDVVVSNISIEMSPEVPVWPAQCWYNPRIFGFNPSIILGRV